MDSIRLIVFPAPKPTGLPSLSPFCVKVDVALKALDIDYKLKIFKGNPSQFPHSKLPVLLVGESMIHDSEKILEEIAKKFNKDLDQGLGEKERSISLAYKRLIENHLYWATSYFRWMAPENWELSRPVMFGHIPKFFQSFVANLAKKACEKQLHGMGLGRHAKADIEIFMNRDLQALSEQLGTQKYLMGEKLTSVDASLYGVLANLFYSKLTPQQDSDTRNKFPKLVEYTERIRTQYYS